MDSSVSTESAAGSADGTLDRVIEWVLLEGDRWKVAVGIVAILVAAFAAAVAADVLAVGTGSAVDTVFGSGLTSGVVTLVTIALSINQLILSRVFGSPNKLRSRLDGSRELRQGVEEIAGVSSSSNDPATFLSLLARTLAERATAAARQVHDVEADLPASAGETLEDVAAYGRSIDDQVAPETNVVDVLGVIVGPEYARNVRAVHDLRVAHRDSLPMDTRNDLEAVEDLLEYLAIVRQFFKTIALQQDFATLSRLLVYSGLFALLASVSMTLVYRPNSITLAPSTLEVVVPLAFAVVLAPLALFAAYVLRAATVAHRTVSVGPFVPPTEG